MNLQHDSRHVHQPVTTVMRTDVATLQAKTSVGDALEAVRHCGIGEKIVYFYIVDQADRLVGVLPTRRFLTAPLAQKLSDAMISPVQTLPDTASILEACEAFVQHKFLAFPVVDAQQRIVGVVDVSLLAAESVDLAGRQAADEIFESIGFRVSQVRDASPWRAFRFRFPWLLATISSGTLCALLSSFYELTLAKSLVLAFFITLVLGLGESVSIQSMTVTIQALRGSSPGIQWYARALRRELGTALLLGLACGLVVGCIVWLWRGAGMAAITIGSSILLALCAASFFGLSIPALLHRLHLDPKIAAGPVTLAFTDLFTLLIYFSLARWML